MNTIKVECSIHAFPQGKEIDLQKISPQIKVTGVFRYLIYSTYLM